MTALFAILRRALVGLGVVLAASIVMPGWAAAAPAQVQPERGIWWNANQPGRGFFIDVNADTVALAGFLYDSAGNATWFIASGQLSGNALTADMKTYRDGQALTGLYRAPTAGPSLGTLTLQFSSAQSATLTWPGGTETLTRYGIGPNGTVVPSAHPDGPATGIWWNAGQSGRGFTLELQGESLLLGGYLYDGAGNPVWFISSAPYQAQTHGADFSTSTFTGAWQQYADGQAIGAPFRPARIADPNVGSYTFSSSWINGSGFLSLTLPDHTVIPLTKFFCDPAQTNAPRCPPPGTVAPPAPVSVAESGVAAIKVRAADPGVALLEETLTSIAQTGPVRRLTLLDNSGAPSGQYTAPAGWSLIDFAQHPSGEVSVVQASNTKVQLVRLDRAANVLSIFNLTDPQAPNDPFYDNGGVHDDSSMVPLFTRDAVRAAPVGESVVVALRTGRNAVVAYRFEFTHAGGYARAWRTLVEPGLSLFTFGIETGTFDTFDALKNTWQVYLDTDASGNVVVAVFGREFFGALFAAHADYFQQPLTALNGVLVTRLSPAGQRIGTTLVDTVQTGELHGLRLNGDDIGLVGRVFTERRGDGTGWDAYAAHVSLANGALSNYRVLDFNFGDVLFDIARLPDGRFLVAGASGYTQNPTGGSVSPQTAPVLAILTADGTQVQHLDVAAGARQNQVRTIATRGAHWVVGGMVNGPGTHSGDGDPGVIRADGFVREMDLGGL